MFFGCFFLNYLPIQIWTNSDFIFNSKDNKKCAAGSLTEKDVLKIIEQKKCVSSFMLQNISLYFFIKLKKV